MKMHFSRENVCDLCVKALFAVLCAVLVLDLSGAQPAKAEAIFPDEYRTVPAGKLSLGNLDVYVNNSKALKLTGATASNWRSNCEEIATVSKKGVVTGVKEGVCRVACTDEDGKVYSCIVTVKKPCFNRTNNQMLMAVGDTFALKLQGAKAVSWKSDNTSLATVSKKGVVTAKSCTWSQVDSRKNVARIICKDANGVEYTCLVTVYPKDYKSHFGLSGEKSVADVKKAIGKNEINKVYVKGEKAYIYYATNGAFGEFGNIKGMLADALSMKYPQCRTSYDMKCVFQYCDGIDANNWCDYSLYYEELTVAEHSEYEDILHEIDVSAGDNYYNYFYPEQKEAVSKLDRKNFGQLYESLLTYDLDADGVLCEGEIDRVMDLVVEDSVSSVKGLDKLTSLYALTLFDYSGKKLDVSGAKALDSIYVFCNTSEITVVGPKLNRVCLETYFYLTDDGMVSKPVKKIDVSSCVEASDLNLQVGNTSIIYKLPAKSDKLESLALYCTNVSSMNLAGYKNLTSFRVGYSQTLSKVDLSKNKKIANVSFYSCKKMTKGGILLPKGVKPDIYIR